MSLIGGKYPHPQTVIPGGISATIDLSDMNEIHLRIVKFFDYGQKVVGVYNDLDRLLLRGQPPIPRDWPPAGQPDRDRSVG